VTVYFKLLDEEKEKTEEIKDELSLIIPAVKIQEDYLSKRKSK
jgi:hypothetical protein